MPETGRETITLHELLALAPDRRPQSVAAHGDPSVVMARLADEAEALAMRDLPGALEATAVLVGVAESLQDDGARAHAYRACGRARAHANRFDEAQAALESAARFARQAGDDEAAARAELALVGPLARGGSLDEAVRVGHRALEGFTGLGLAEWAAKAEVNLGVARRMLNQPDVALAHFDRARSALGSEPVSIAQLESNRADALLELSRFQEAEQAFRATLDAFQHAGMSRFAAIAEGNIADLLSRQGRLDRALHHFERARRRFERDAAPGDLARLQSEQAEAYAAAGMLDEAAHAYREALDPLEAHGLALEAARAWAGLGRVLVEIGADDEAERVLAEAARRFAGLEHTQGLGRVAVSEGELALARGDGNGARRRLEQALEHLQDRPAEAAALRYRLALLDLSAGDLEGADRHLERALDVAIEAGLAPLLADLLHARGRLRLAQGDNGRAVEDLRAAVRQIERVRGSFQADRMRVAFAARRSGPYEDLVSGLLAQRPDGVEAEVFHAIEHAKARALLDLVAGALQCETLAMPEQDDDASTLVAEAVRMRGELNALWSSPPELRAAGRAAWQAEVDANERSLAALEARLASTGGVGGLFSAPASLEAVQARLDGETALVEYFVAGEEILALVVRHGGAELVRGLAGPAELEELVELVEFQLGRVLGYNTSGELDAIHQDARRELASLAEAVFTPLAARLGEPRALIVVPHGQLHAVPFHALVHGQRHLIERYAMASVPSASLLCHLGTGVPGPGAAKKGSLIMGVPDETAPHIADEVGTVAATLPAASVHCGPDATRERFLAEAGEARLIHLACHGRFEPRAPLASGLKLADGWLTVRDLYGLRLDGAVVVLSGCETGRAERRGGDEQIGLIRAFFAAGASALLVSQWALHDETAGKLMASIYELWQNGRSEGGPGLAAAVRGAQRHLIEAGAHPGIWAPFTLYGRP
jgi:tetratricopeptide (TPR) repeat protein